MDVSMATGRGNWEGGREFTTTEVTENTEREKEAGASPAVTGRHAIAAVDDVTAYFTCTVASISYATSQL